MLLCSARTTRRLNLSLPLLTPSSHHVAVWFLASPSAAAHPSLHILFGDGRVCLLSTQHGIRALGSRWRDALTSLCAR